MVRGDLRCALRHAEAALSEGRRALRPFVAECLYVKAKAHEPQANPTPPRPALGEARGIFSELGLDERLSGRFGHVGSKRMTRLSASVGNVRLSSPAGPAARRSPGRLARLRKSARNMGRAI